MRARKVVLPTLDDVRRGAETYLGGRAPSLHQLAAFVNVSIPGWSAKVEPWSYTPDKAPRGFRLRIPGRTRKGNRLELYREGELRPCRTHNSMEPYRKNADVCRMIINILEGNEP